MQNTEKDALEQLLTKSITRHLILYTDGSFYPIYTGAEDGYHGSGAHGYVYEENVEKTTTTDKPTKYTMTNIGYVSNDELDTNVMHTVLPIYYIDACYSYTNKGTNNTAELYAVINSLEDVLKNNDIFDLASLRLLIDSQYVVSVVHAICNDGYCEYTSNREIIEKLTNVIKKVKDAGINIIVYKVKGHADDLGNMTADRLAFFGRIMSTRREVISNFYITNAKTTKYWKLSVNRHPFLVYKQLFFTNALAADPKRIIYSLLEYATNDAIGKKTPNATFGLVMLSDPPDIIENAIKYFHHCAWNMRDFAIISTINLDNLYNRDTYHYFNIYNDKSFIYHTKNNSVINILNTPLVYNIQPVGLAEQAIEKMNRLYYILDSYNARNTKCNDDLVFIDITNEIYTITEDKKGKTKYTTKIDNGVNYITIKVKVGDQDIEVPLDLGKDTLPRNQYKQLEKNLPKVILVIDKSVDKIYKYYTITELNNGDIGIYCNFYSNKIYLDSLKK